jgi:hypothetical protein
LDKLADICELLEITIDELIYGKKERPDINKDTAICANSYAALENPYNSKGISSHRYIHIMLCIFAFLVLFAGSAVVLVTSLVRNAWSKTSYDEVYARVERVYDQYTKADISYTNDEGRHILKTVWLDMDGVRDGDYIMCYTDQNKLFMQYNKSTLIIPGVFTLVAFFMLVLLFTELLKIKKENYTHIIKENGEDEE